MKEKTFKIKVEKKPKESIRMFRDLLLVRECKILEDKTDGGIIIPGTIENEVRYFEIIETGPEVRGVKRGEKIISVKSMGLNVEFNGETLHIMREKYIDGVLE